MNIQKYILLLASSLFAFYPTYGAFTPDNAQNPQGQTSLHLQQKQISNLKEMLIGSPLEELNKAIIKGDLENVQKGICAVKNKLKKYKPLLQVEILTRALHSFLKEENLSLSKCLNLESCLTLKDPKVIEMKFIGMREKEKESLISVLMVWGRETKLTQSVHEESDFLDVIWKFFYFPHYCIVKEFMKNGVNPNKSINGRTLLQMIGLKKRKEMVELLVKPGVSHGHTSNENNHTPLHYSLVHKK